jgi:hypothetical protein
VFPRATLETSTVNETIAAKEKRHEVTGKDESTFFQLRNESFVQLESIPNPDSTKHSPFFQLQQNS